MKRLSFILLSALLTSGVYAQDLKLPALSPTSKLTQEFSTSNIEISYSRPSMRGRKIFGELVAFGNVWRTGANSATKVKFGEDVTVGGQAVKAGEYALYTIPGVAEWEIILNKGVGNWGNAGYDKADDVARFKIAPKALDKNVQTFTINIGNITYSSCNIELMWEKTKVIIPVKANNEERLSASIDKAINNPNIPYFQAANYYFETDQNLDKAIVYVDKALEANPKAFWMWSLKARIAQKMGKKDDAINAANKAMEVAKGSAFEAEYVNNMTKLINSYKKS
jgi:tetratricopeptide (TPR) repeat protein